jgi:hypothetical protein
VNIPLLGGSPLGSLSHGSLFRRVAYRDLLAVPKAGTRWADVRDVGPALRVVRVAADVRRREANDGSTSTDDTVPNAGTSHRDCHRSCNLGDAVLVLVVLGRRSQARELATRSPTC